MNGIYIIIGGNLGDRLALIEDCKHKIEKEIGIISRSSSIYESASWGETDNPNYLNQVLYIESNFSAKEVLEKALEIEKELGRTRDKKWESRLIDIDILFFNEEIIDEKNLKIPHPHLQNRKFVLVPLNEIANEFIHPLFKKNMIVLLDECKDELRCTVYKSIDNSDFSN
jgi:2-amino-4-hydroxy-6-hydroxymethyldihydropteridine diphosphokinase